MDSIYSAVNAQQDRYNASKQQAGTGAICGSNAQNGPKEPSICDRAQELHAHIECLANEQSLTRSKLFAEGEAPGSLPNGPMLGSLEQMVAFACERIANLVGEARTINRRL